MANGAQFPQDQAGLPPQGQAGALPPPEEAAGDEELNPVLQALETLQTFVAAQKQSGNQNADKIGASLLQLIQTIGGNTDVPGGGERPPAQEPPIRPAGQVQGARPEMAGGGARPDIPSL